MPGRIAKKARLVALERQIRKRGAEWWLFPTDGAVKGFLGDGPIMFVAERPSVSGRHGILLQFYELLEKCGAANSHLTDVIKTRGRVGAPYPRDMSEHRELFDRELRIVRPRKIVAFGQKVYDLLQFALAGSNIEVIRIWHYANLRYPGRVKEFRRQLRAAVKK